MKNFLLILSLLLLVFSTDALANNLSYWLNQEQNKPIDLLDYIDALWFVFLTLVSLGVGIKLLWKKIKYKFFSKSKKNYYD